MSPIMKTVKHSVIIPCHDAEDTLPEQLEALSEQTLDAPWEVIVADNGSTDRLEQAVAPFRKHLSLRLIDASGRPGAGYARNQGVRAARGEQLSFVDADDVVGKGWLAAISRALDAHPFAASRHEVMRLNAPEVLESHHSRQLNGLQEYSYPPFLPHSGGCGLGVQRWLHERIGGFDPEFLYLEDTDYCWRAQLAGVVLAFAPEAVVHVRFRTRSKSIYHQARQNGIANVHLYHRYRPLGMPRLPWKPGAGAWLALLRTLPQLLEADTRPRWLWQFGWRYGRLLGSLRYRTLAL